MEAEWSRVWCRSWLLAGLESDLTETGDYFVFEVGKEQILLTRTAEGSVAGFYNVCQHRGNLLVSSERGQASNFRCAYHAWTYELDGRLKSVPFEERFAQGVPCAERSLKPVHIEIWDGFVFVCLAENPPPLSDYLGPLASMLAPYRFADMTLTQDQSVDLRCNWKAVVDNFSELYHVDFLHPQHRRMVDCCNDLVHLFEGGHTGLEVPGATVSPRFPVPDQPTDLQSMQLESLGLRPDDFKGRVLDVRVAVQEAKRKLSSEESLTTWGVDYQRFADDQLSDVWQFNLFPNVILSFAPEHCWVMRVLPDANDPQRCRFDKLTLSALPASALPAERPPRDRFNHGSILGGEKTMTDTIDQDIELLGSVQQGMASAGFDSVWLNDDEMRVQHFHNELDRLMDL